MITKDKYYVVYWTKWEGFLFQSVPSKTAALACAERTDYNSILCLRVPDDG